MESEEMDGQSLSKTDKGIGIEEQEQVIKSEWKVGNIKIGKEEQKQRSRN